MEIQIKVQRRIPGLKSKKIRQNLQKVLSDLGCRDGELSILLTDDRVISDLNRRYLNRKGPTNVLAFPMAEGAPVHDEPAMLGDVAVSVDTAIRESTISGDPLETTVFRLLIHGILHLFSYDHERSPEEAHRMEEQEKRLLSLINEGD